VKKFIQQLNHLSSYSREKCTDAKPAQQVLTIVGTFKNAIDPELALSRYLENNFKFILPADEEKMLRNFTTLPGNRTSLVKFTKDIKNDILNVEDPYIFFAFDHNDFDIEDANFERMIEQAENQNADVVAAAYRDEFGHWDQSCLHIHLQNYTLDVWTGYYKSHLGMKYCDASFGPLLVRKEALPKLFEIMPVPFSAADILLTFTKHSNFRVLQSPDSMFYVTKKNDLTRDKFLRLAERLFVNKVKIEDIEFKYNCNEIGAKCNLDSAKAGYAQPHCCLEVFKGLQLVAYSELVDEGFNQSCFAGGTALAGVKIPGGVLPWEIDVDFLMARSDWMNIKKKVLPKFRKYDINAGGFEYKDGLG